MRGFPDKIFINKVIIGGAAALGVAATFYYFFVSKSK
jgi:hypothetical protein